MLKRKKAMVLELIKSDTIKIAINETKKNANLREQNKLSLSNEYPYYNQAPMTRPTGV